MSLKNFPRKDLWYQPLLRDYLGRLRDYAEQGPVTSLTGHSGHGYTLRSFKSSLVRIDAIDADEDHYEVTRTLSPNPHLNLVAARGAGKTITCKALISQMCSPLRSQEMFAFDYRLPILIECRGAKFFPEETLADHVIRTVTPLLKAPSDEAFSLIREFINEGDYALLIDDLDLLDGSDLEIAMRYVTSSVKLEAGVLATSAIPLCDISDSPLVVGRPNPFARQRSLWLVQQWLEMYRTPKEEAQAFLSAFRDCPLVLQPLMAEPETLRLIYDVYSAIKTFPKCGFDLYEQALTFCSQRVTPKTPGLTRADQRRLWDAVGYHVWKRTDSNPYLTEAEFQEVIKDTCLSLTFSEAEAIRVSTDCLKHTLENCGLLQRDAHGVKFSFPSMVEACAARYLAYRMVSPDFVSGVPKASKLLDSVRLMTKVDSHRSGVLKALDLIRHKDGQEWYDAIAKCTAIFDVHKRH